MAEVTEQREERQSSLRLSRVATELDKVNRVRSRSISMQQACLFLRPVLETFGTSVSFRRRAGSKRAELERPRRSR